MSIRVDVQLDHGSESLRWIATATLDGKHLHPPPGPVLSEEHGRISHAADVNETCSALQKAVGRAMNPFGG